MRITPERLWLASTALHNSGHPRLSRRLRRINRFLFQNSLSPAISLSPDIRLGHRGLGIVVHRNVEIGRKVRIWQHATIAVRALDDSPHRVVIEDDVVIGANAVIITPERGSIRIGRGARVGAGAVVTKDVPAGATIVGPQSRVIEPSASAPARETREGEPAPATELG